MNIANSSLMTPKRRAIEAFNAAECMARPTAIEITFEYLLRAYQCGALRSTSTLRTLAAVAEIIVEIKILVPSYTGPYEGLAIVLFNLLDEDLCAALGEDRDEIECETVADVASVFLRYLPLLMADCAAGEVAAKPKTRGKATAG
ncbi:hypothetical protein [Alsobacter sp. R-9]